MSMAAARNAAGLIAARFFLGIPESGVGSCSSAMLLAEMKQYSDQW